MPGATDIRPYRRRIVSVIVVTQLVLGALTAAGVYFGYDELNDNIGSGERIEHNIKRGETEALNVLVMGEDTRVGKGNALDGSREVAEGGGSRSDTTILLHIREDRDKIYGVSLPRDAMVARPDCEVGGKTIPGEDPVMFNSAFAVGGPQCTIQTVESLTGIYIDHFVVVDFNGFKQMVDAVGGVEVCIPEDVDDDEHNIHFEAGTQQLEGQQALDYVRERYQLSVTGDIGRMRRQQAFLASMINKVMSAGTLSRPDRVYSFLDAVTGSIEVDADIDSVGTLVDLASQFRGTDLKNIRFVTVPFAEYEPDPNRLEWTDDADRLWRRIRNDQPLGKHLSEGALKAADELGSATADADPEESGGEESASPSDDATSGGGRGEVVDTQKGDGISEKEEAERIAAGLCV